MCNLRETVATENLKLRNCRHTETEKKEKLSTETSATYTF